LKTESYSLSNVSGPDKYFLDFYKWDQEFSKWEDVTEYDSEKANRQKLRFSLVNEFIGIWQNRFDDLSGPTPKNGVSAIEHQKSRREFVEENSYYQSIYVKDELHRIVPQLVAEKRIWTPVANICLLPWRRSTPTVKDGFGNFARSYWMGIGTN
jgi:hypothetical protein